ncbi:MULTISPECIES: hypothetical protein [Nocardioides]|uniref:DUF4233 domain-containing protein n=1 Tax=Nocardioides vastitatis TaxID=2568655 RepID=A0ABW0ZB58_9ACTN|nr:hypothetical protein [Nocardioides sp.]THI97200.1 hypothetical protein E7Z54_15020 [Nocardioides sp.]
MSESPTAYPTKNPPPLTVAASLVGVQGVVLLLLAILEFASVTSGRLAMGLSTAGFFAAYGAVLVAAAWGLASRRGWSRGPVLITQLILLGLAWSLREHVAVAIGLVTCAGIVLAGLLHPDTIEALEGQPSSSD